jgi:hypothetical protein
MAMMKKKMAAKPAIKKAQNGRKTPTTNTNPEVLVKGAVKDTLQSNVGGKNQELADVKVKTRGNAFTTAAKSTRNFLKEDYFGGKDSTKTKPGRTFGKIANTVFKTAYAPLVGASNLLIAAGSPLKGKTKITDKDKDEGRLYFSNAKERAAEKAASDSTNAANAAKKANQRKMGGKVAKMGGKVAKKVAPKMMMKKMSKKK